MANYGILNIKRNVVTNMTTIYLVRHAQAEGNLCRRMHGQYDSNLTVAGLKQIKDLRERFEGIPLDACYCSDLTRAENTAQAICDATGLEYRVDPGFREVCVGEWEDIPFGFLNTFHGLKMTQFGRDPMNWAVNGSETFRQYTGRFLMSMEDAARRHAGGSIAIVAHSVVMRGVLTALFPEAQIPHSANTSVSCLEYENGRYSLKYLNDASHLKAAYKSSRQKWWQQDGAQGDDTFWFRPGLTELDGLTPTASPVTYTVLEAQRAVGLICLSEEDETSYLDYLGLIESYRGYGLGIQLLGQAVSVSRERGKTYLAVRPGVCAALDAMCGKFGFRLRENGWSVLDLTPRVQSY